MERSKFLVGGKRNTLAVGAAGEGGGAAPSRKYRQRSHSPLWQRQAVMNAGLGLTTPKRRGGGGGGKAPTVLETLRAVGVGNGAATVAAITGADRKTGRINRRGGTGNPRQQQQHSHQQFTDKSHTTATMGGNGAKRKRIQRGHYDFPATKWLLKPQSNFRHTSESTSSVNDDDVDQTAPSPSPMSSPPASSPTLDTPLQPQIVVPDEPKQTRETTPTTTTTETKTPPPVPKKPKLKRQSHLSVVSCKSISSGYHTLLDSSNDEDSVWCKEKNYERPIVVRSGRSKSLKLTATVIKIVPEQTRAVAGGAEATVADSKQPVQSTQQQTKLQEQQGKLQQQEFKPMLQPQQQQQQQQQQQVKPPSQQQQQLLVKSTVAAAALPAVPKIVRVEQHKVPRTIEDGIDISYQYFVNLPLARGKKPLPIRYLYRPMVRRLNGATPSRHSSKRSKKSSTAQSEATTDQMELNDQIELNDSQEDEAQTRIDAGNGNDNNNNERVVEERVETETLSEQDKAVDNEAEDVTEQDKSTEQEAEDDEAEQVAVEKEQSVESSEVYTDMEEQAIIQQQLLMEQLKRQQFAMYAPPPIVVPQKYSPLVKLLNRHPMPKEQPRPLTSLSLQQQVQKQRQLRQQQLQYLRQLTQGATGTEPQTSEFDAKFLPLFEKLNRHQLQQQQQFEQQQQSKQLTQQQQQQPQQQQLTKQQQQQQHAELQLEHQHQQQQLKRLQHEQEQLQYLQEQLKRKQQLNQVQQQQLLAHRQLQLLQQQQQLQHEAQQKRPTLIDYQTKSTRLDTVGGVNISFHAPIRMGAGGEQGTLKVTATDATATAATAGTAATAETAGTATEPHCNCNKCVSFKLDQHKHTNNSINKSTSNTNKNKSNTRSYRRGSLQSAGDGNEELSKGKPQQKLPTMLEEDELRRKKKSKQTRGKKRSHK